MNRIKHYLCSFYTRINKLFIELAWKNDAKRLKANAKSFIPQSINFSAKVLILAPHSDDEWIGCSQIISNFPNTVICNMDMSGGDTIELHKTRREEMKSVAAIYNRQFTSVSSDKIKSLSKIIESINPEYICCPSIYDWHPEHIEVISILKRVIAASSYSGHILSYHVSIPMPMSQCNIVMPMTREVQENKWEVFKKAYKSQSFMPVTRFKKQEEINGAYFNLYSAEVYNCKDSESWIRQNYLSNEEMFKLKQNINNISSIRSIVERINCI